MALGLKPRVEGMPPYHHSLCKNAEVTDFIFLLTGYFQLSNPNQYSACAGDQGLPAMRPSCGGGNEQAAILPHSAGASVVTKRRNRYRKPTPPTRGLGHQLIKATKQS